ncbi:MAG: hypothetical protein QM702_20650 [Rubrivivax sp.]
MIASYILSRTLRSTLALFADAPCPCAGGGRPASRGWFSRVNDPFNALFKKLRSAYAVVLAMLLHHPKSSPSPSSVSVRCPAPCIRRSATILSVGRRGPDEASFSALQRYADRGNRRIADEIDQAIRDLVGERGPGLPAPGQPGGAYSGINLSYSNAGTIGGPLDGEIMISLKPGHRPTEHYMSLLRKELPDRFPGIKFQPADIVTQILNFGLPSAINAGADVRFQSGARHQGGAGRGGCPHPSEDGSAGPGGGHRSAPGAAGRPQCGQCRPEHAGLAGRQLPDGARLLVESGQQALVYGVAVQTPQYQIDSLDAFM